MSDLHLKPEGGAPRYNQELVIDAAKVEIEKLADGPYRPDLLIFSGDLVNSADDNLFKDGREVLETFASAAGLDNSRVAICPGNHDVSRNAVGVSIPLLQNFRQKARDINEANQLTFDQRFISYTGNVLGSFNSLYRLFSAGEEVYGDFLSRSYVIGKTGLGIVCTNTAALSAGGLIEQLTDERNLFASEISLDRALKALPTDAVKIVVGHHPLSFLNETNEAVIKTLLQKYAAAYFCGHLHRASPEFVHSPQGDTTYVQAGSLYATRPWWNGFAVFSIDVAKPNYQRILYKKWHEERREFGLATEFNDEGIVYNGDESRSFWSNVRPRVSAATWETWRKEKLIPAIDAECAKDLTGVFEQQRFIEPDFEKDRYVTTDQGIEKASQPVALSFGEVLEDNSNFVVFAQAESGKTTLLREWARRLSWADARQQDWLVPVILRFSELRNYTGFIERLIKQRLPDLPQGASHIDLLQSGKLVVLIDDVQLSRIRDKGGLADFIKAYPHNKYVLLTSNVYLQGAGIAPVIVEGINFDHIRSKQLRTSQVLALIENHGMKDPTQADRLLQRMMVEATSLNVPITPVTGSFLIQIYTEDNATTLVNKANLVERYVEISLEKFAPAELLPQSFDFRNKTDLLSFIAEKMARNDAYQASEAEVVGWINAYLAEFGLRFSTLDLLEYFVQARVLERADGSVAFRLNAFFEYFAAVRMSEDDEFREYALADVNYLRFPNEISFYAAISRKDLSWLNTLVDRFESSYKEANSGAHEGFNAAAVLESFVLPASDASVENLRELEDKAFNSVLPEEDRRKALDDDYPLPALPAKPTKREGSPDVGHRWMAQLTLLSAMLKNMELVPSKRKAEILEKVLTAWLEFMAMSLRMVPTLAEQRRLKFAGVDYIVVYPDDMDAGELAQRLYMYMPVSTAKIVSFHLGTEKLRVQLEQGIGSIENQPPALQFLRGAILAQLGVEGLPDILESVAKSLHGKRYLQEVFFRLLAELVVRYRLPEKDRQRVSALAAEVRVGLEGAKGSQAARRKGSIMKALNSSRIKIQYSAGGG